MKPFYSSKEFVNLAGYNSDASIFTQVLFYNEESPSCDATLKLRDCGNTVHFSIGLANDGDRSYKNSLFKIDVLIRELTTFRRALVEAKAVADQREEAYQVNKNQNKNHEVDPGPHNYPTGNGAHNTTDPSLRGL
jgi:hypothetical protein